MVDIQPDTVTLQAQAKGKANGSGKEADSTQNQQAGKVEGLIEDIDLSDVPADQLELFKAKLAEKVKNYDKGFRTKTEALSEREKTLKADEDSLLELKAMQKLANDNPKLGNAFNKIVADFKTGKLDTEAKVSKAEKKLDRMIDQADDASQKESLRDIREIIKDETPIQPLQEEVRALKEEMAMLRKTSNIGITSKIEDGITGLKDRFGKEMIDKHASNITAMCTKYPEQSVYSVFKHLCSDDDFTTALLSERDKKSKSELKRKKDGSEPGGPTSVNKIEAVRGKGGRIDWRSHLQKLKDAGRFS